MKKTAIAAVPILKAVAGAGLVGGAGYGGYRYGAHRMGGAMADEFAVQNMAENKAIRDNFRAYNRKENSEIANAALKKGFELGMMQKKAGLVKKIKDMYVASAKDIKDIPNVLRRKTKYAKSPQIKAMYNDELKKNIRGSLPIAATGILGLGAGTYAKTK